MKIQDLTKKQRRTLAVLALIGLVGPNGIFIYYSIVDASAIHRTLGDPIALAFIAESFLTMGIMAWLIRARGRSNPGWVSFIIMSLLGSLAFSFPAYLWATNRPTQPTH